MLIKCSHCNKNITQFRNNTAPFLCPHCNEKIEFEEFMKQAGKKTPERKVISWKTLREMIEKTPNKKIDAKIEKKEATIFMKGPIWIGGCFFVFAFLIWSGAMVAPITTIFLVAKFHPSSYGIMLTLLFAVWFVEVGCLWGIVVFLFGKQSIHLQKETWTITKTFLGFKKSSSIQTKSIQDLSLRGIYIQIKTAKKKFDLHQAFPIFQKPGYSFHFIITGKSFVKTSMKIHRQTSRNKDSLWLIFINYKSFFFFLWAYFSPILYVKTSLSMWS